MLVHVKVSTENCVDSEPALNQPDLCGKQGATPTELAVTERSFVLARQEVELLGLGERLGAGESSEVFASSWQGRPLVLKQAREGFDEVLLREARAMSLLQGEQVVRLRGVGKGPEGLLRLALERLPGPSVQQLLQQGLGGLEAFELARKVLEGAGSALLQLHAVGWAHGDIKPANLLFRDGASSAIVLIDLGLATDAGEIQGGTPAYLPPDMWQGARVSPQQADTYALALTLRQILGEPTDDSGALAQQLRQVIAPVLAPEARRRPSLRALWEDAIDRGLVDPRRWLGDAIRREYIATRLDELNEKPRSAPLASRVTGKPATWLGPLLRQLVDLRELGGPSVCSDHLGPEGSLQLSDMSAHDRRRLLGRLVGPPAVSWAIGEPTDDELVGALLSFSGDLRQLTFGQLRELLDGASVVSELPRLRLQNEAEVAFRLCHHPVSHALLTCLAQSLNVAPALALRAAQVARRQGKMGLCQRLLRDLDTEPAKWERALVAYRCGERALGLGAARELATHASDPSVRGQATALLCRERVDAGCPEEALSRAEAGPVCAQLCESKALAHLSLGQLKDARAEVARGLALTEDDEQSARLWGVLGMLDHAASQPFDALANFEKAVAHASSAGATLEEATYLTGVASAASDSGKWAIALAASERAESLLEALEQQPMTARALLARASVLAALGAGAELKVAVRRGIVLARKTADRRCEAFLLLCEIDAAAQPSERAASAQRAATLLQAESRDDQLRAAARLLRATQSGVERGDQLASEVTNPDALLDWWGARAALLSTDAESQAAPELVAQPIVDRLRALARGAPAGANKGPALCAGGDLALRTGLARDAWDLLGQAFQCVTQFLDNVPAIHLASAEQLPWVRRAKEVPQPVGSGGAQLADVEALLRALGQGQGFKALLDQVLDMLLYWTGVQRGLLLLRAPSDKLVVRAARHMGRRELSSQQRSLSLSMAQRAISEGRPVVCVDAMGDQSQWTKSIHALSLRSVLAVPLVARGEILGVAYLDDRVRRGAFGKREIAWATLIGTIAALAICDERERLQLRRAVRQAKRAQARADDRLAQRGQELDRTSRELGRLKGDRYLLDRYPEIVTESPAMLRLLGLIDRVAQSDVPAVILGESGTGKELVARAIARGGSRKAGPFVAENCGAVPDGLMESTLFGHRKGAFTGASHHQAGLFALADGGTLFLDEIGEMSLSLQTKLLRVLQEGEVRPLGATRPQRVDVRVVAASNRDLEHLVEEGKFREDLFFRISVVRLVVPPLRDRREDVSLLVDHFFRRHGAQQGRTISPTAVAHLRAFSWPGNVRQLENEVRRLLVLGGREIRATDLSPEIVASNGGFAKPTTLREKVDVLERKLLLEALESCEGNRTRAAEALGISRFGLQKMSQRLGIEFEHRLQRSGRNPSRGLDVK